MAFELKEEGFKLVDVLKVVGIPEATYHYHVNQFQHENADQELKERITHLCTKHGARYGYRRIHQELKRQGYVINHKKVLRIMSELHLTCTKFRRKSRYTSYRGTVGTLADNRLRRRFYTPYPLQKLVTDVTEFKCIGDTKLYFSPIMDLYNGEIVSYAISTKPTLDFVMRSLDQIIPIIHQSAPYRTTIHSDQGFHYQHRLWVTKLKRNGIFQSMSRKATCADNASMENFFGVMKQEMYHGEPLKSYQELHMTIEQYIQYYNHERIKMKLAGLSPVEYRTKANQLTA